MSAKGKKILVTILSTVGMLFFYIASGAIVVIQGLEGTEGAFVQGGFIWCFAILLLLITFIKNKSLTPLGFTKINPAGFKSVLYCIPVILIALSNLYGGFVKENIGKTILASFILTTGVGFSEEMVCRGIICNIWKDTSVIRGIAVSSIIFGLCHSFNILGGASVVATILQVFFAFFYGIAMAIIFIKTESLIPCIFLHFLHDFCSFISTDVSLKTDIIIGAIQVAVLIFYTVWCRVQLCKNN